MECRLSMNAVSNDSQVILCSLCRKHSQSPKKADLGRAVWVDLACKSLMKQSLVKHSQSELHITAIKMEADLYSSWRDGGITLAFQ